MSLPRYELRPMQSGGWIGPLTPDRRWHGRFRATWSDTLDLLRYETGLLGTDLVVIQVDISDSDLRRDGQIRAGARPRQPGVRVSFESLHGPLTYATDAYDHWRANVRAIALALQALRAVDRYGVTHSGEQYRGWNAIGASTTVDHRGKAADLLARHGGGWLAEELLVDAAAVRRCFRAAARKHHPDAGGDPALFDRLLQARDLLIRGGRG